MCLFWDCKMQGRQAKTSAHSIIIMNSLEKANIIFNGALPHKIFVQCLNALFLFADCVIDFPPKWKNFLKEKEQSSDP